MGAGWDSSVGMAICYVLDGPEFESLWGRNFPRTSRPVLGPTQHPIRWVVVLFARGEATWAWC